MKRRQVLEQLRQERAERKKQQEDGQPHQRSHDPPQPPSGVDLWYCPHCGEIHAEPVEGSSHEPSNLEFDDPNVVGYLVYLEDEWLVEDGAQIVTGNVDELFAFQDEYGQWAHFQPMTAADLFSGLASNIPYALDAPAYNKFWPQAQQMGLPFGPVDFPEPQELMLGPFHRVQMVSHGLFFGSDVQQ